MFFCNVKEFAVCFYAVKCYTCLNESSSYIAPKWEITSQDFLIMILKILLSKKPHQLWPQRSFCIQLSGTGFYLMYNVQICKRHVRLLSLELCLGPDWDQGCLIFSFLSLGITVFFRPQSILVLEAAQEMGSHLWILPFSEYREIRSFL